MHREELRRLAAARPRGAHYVVDATCYDLGGTMADGNTTHYGAVANNFLALGTRIHTDRPYFGISDFTVEDRIGYGTQLDIWSASGCAAFGRQTVGFTVER